MVFFSLLHSLTHFVLQTANGVSSKVMDDYCWIHSTFHVRSEYQGNVGCILDNVLAGNLILDMEFQARTRKLKLNWGNFFG